MPSGGTDRREGKQRKMEGEEITKEQYGVEPDVPSTNLSILFAITALSFSISPTFVILLLLFSFSTEQ